MSKDSVLKIWPNAFAEFNNGWWYIFAGREKLGFGLTEEDAWTDAFLM